MQKHLYIVDRTVTVAAGVGSFTFNVAHGKCIETVIDAPGGATYAIEILTGPATNVSTYGRTGLTDDQTFYDQYGVYDNSRFSFSAATNGTYRVVLLIEKMAQVAV